MDLATITPKQGVEAMLAFYREERASACDLAKDGDMLLYQWGTFDLGHGPHFQIDITRQLIVGEGEDDDIWQLHLTFRYEASETLRSLGAGNRWCPEPGLIPEFHAYIRESPPMMHSDMLCPVPAEVSIECAV